MKAVLVLNGEPPAVRRLQELASEYPIYAADGGSRVCVEAGVKPEWVVGDFDSQSQQTLPDDWAWKHFPEQDRTDFQKLLASLPAEVSSMLILGGLGRRLDHQLTNLLIAMTIPESVEVVFEQDETQLFRVTSAKAFTQAFAAGTTMSLLPLGNISGVDTQGLKWNLQAAEMGPGLQLGQSNVVEGELCIKLKSGQLYVWVGEVPAN